MSFTKPPLSLRFTDLSTALVLLGLTSKLTSDFHLQFFFQVLLADCRRLFRRSSLIRNAVKFDDSPAAKAYLFERREDRRQINSTTPQFDEAISLWLFSCLARHRAFYVLYVQKEDAVTVFSNRFGR